jgi:ankyrin repeat protein
MVSKTAMAGLVKGFRAGAVGAALDETPALKAVRDERGRSWLHLACATKAAPAAMKDSVRTAEVLLEHGFDLDEPAFTEGLWQATPLWFAVSRGRNLVLAEFLLKRGCNPNYCLWAAAFNDDPAAVRLLVRHGAEVDDKASPETPFLAAVGWSKFAAAEALLTCGANPDARDAKGRTALHLMLKKGSEAAHLAMVVEHGARGDIGDADGVTAIDMLARKRDPAFRELAARLRGR